MLHPANPKVLAFLRHAGEERVLVVANLSRFPQYVELDLLAWRVSRPSSFSDRCEFPRIGSGPLPADAGPTRFFLVRPAAAGGPSPARLR